MLRSVFGLALISAVLIVPAAGEQNRRVAVLDFDYAAARREARGRGRVGTMVTFMAFTAELAPLMLLIQGKDITIAKGTDVTAYVNGNTIIGLTGWGGVESVSLAPVPRSPSLPGAPDPR